MGGEPEVLRPRRLRGQLGVRGEYATLRESIEAAISSEHPFCAEFLAPLASQAQSALVIRPGVHGVANGLAGMIGWATPAALRQVIEAIDAHMRQEHAAP